MKNIVLLVLALCCYASSIHAQVEYKQNFLLAFSKQPDIKDCEAAYSFLSCKNELCAVFNKTKAMLSKSYEELTIMQVALNNSMISSSAPVMNAESAEKLAEQLKNMTEEEKQKWAMQNAKNFMPSAAVHVNKDIDNQPVNDAVTCVTDQQAKNMQNIKVSTDSRSQFSTIEKKYKPKIGEALKRFRTTARLSDTLSSPYSYVLGEISAEEDARFEKALEEYRKTVLPIYSSEMIEKLKCVLQTEQDLMLTYKPIEEKIALTNYGDDAQETTNKMHLITGHLTVLQNVRMNIDMFEEILTIYADQYAALMRIKTVKEVNEKKN